MKKWLSIIGIGDDGLNGLSAKALEVINQSEIIIGGTRHLALIPNSESEKIPWGSPLSTTIEHIKAKRGNPVTVLATGNPLWFGIGSTLLKHFTIEEVEIIPQSSAFSLVAAKLGWSIEQVECLSIHGRPHEIVRKSFYPKAKLIVLTNNSETPNLVAQFLREDGYKQSKITAYAHIGGEKEEVVNGTAEKWNHSVPDFHTLAIEVIPDTVVIPNAICSGLPDHCFENDGLLTKREIRASTITRLMPIPGQLLWDIGAGCGSIGIEWLRAAPNSSAIAIEPEAKRREFIKLNATRLGVPNISIIAEKAPDCFTELSAPDAIFIGGGLASEGMIEKCFQSLKAGGRLVANAVTIEGENHLLVALDQFGGELTRIAISHLSPVGNYRSWKPALPITQWSTIKQ